MKLAITLLVAAVMPFGLVVLVGVVASRILARYHRQWRAATAFHTPSGIHHYRGEAGNHATAESAWMLTQSQ